MLARLLLTAACLGAAAAPAAADLIITVGPAAVAPGGTTTVDVTITGPDLGSLDYFVAAFTVTPAGGAPAGGVDFLDPQTAAIVGDANYVFAGRSDPLSFSRVLSGGVLTVADDATDPAPTGFTGPRLLARLDLTALPTAPVGAQYRVEIDPTGTQFQDAGGNDLGYTATAGTVTVVPEPGVLALLGIGAAGPVLVRRVGRRAGAG